MWIFAAYLVLALCVIFFSARLGYYVDLLDQKTTLASAFIGGVMLAAVTSLPELFTSITSVAAVGKPALVVGNILGSDLFNAFVLGLVFLIWFRGLMAARVTRSHVTTAVCVLAVYIILGVTCLWGRSLLLIGVSAISLVIAVLYAVSIKMMSGDEDTGDKEDVCPLSVRQVVTRFVFYAVLLVIASILITYASDYIGETLGLGTTLAGALLLGIVTSLPEMISCFVLARVGNFNAMVGNIVGSNMFNFIILVVADVVYWNHDLYVYDGQGRLLLLTGVVSAAAVLVLTSLLARTGSGQNKRPALPVALLSVVPVVCYGAFVALSTGL